MEPNEAIIRAAIDLAFDAGKWTGQVELEEHYDNEQYSQVALESMNSRKTTMPNESQSKGKTIKINLRSLEWRDGVKIDSNKYKEKAVKIILNNLIR